MKDVILSKVNTTTFLLNLGATVFFLALAIRSGKMGVRKQHFYFVALTFLSLMGSVWQAELYGKGFVFNQTRLIVHLCFAFGALLSFPGVVFSGRMLMHKATWRKAHKRWIGIFVSLVAFSVLTAMWMFVDAQSKT
ncbi:MAG: hypothetical protein ACI84O_001230 [Myxococcota bacterium]|jgi:hypothetical protein